jgi:hypothetical protein
MLRLFASNGIYAIARDSLTPAATNRFYGGGGGGLS